MATLTMKEQKMMRLSTLKRRSTQALIILSRSSSTTWITLSAGSPRSDSEVCGNNGRTYERSLICSRYHRPNYTGIMPLQTYSSFIRLTKLCGIHVPDSMQADLEPIKVSRYHSSMFIRSLFTAPSTTTKK